ncbi:MAG: pyridoxal phosphate-dependent aminotransferase family protein [Zoogloeaceae bacterium]|jgi:7-keto-8-aminopelargonate synthetase-like enzyme|nr:pyridoxal phosphate-dependent aminotransferase family protein [Zoogloeaceae bacterium]
MLKRGQEIVTRVGFNPYRADFDDQHFIDLASNNYLGLARHERVKEAAIRAIHEHGVSLCGTPVASGHSALARETARRLAAFCGLEAALLFPSGYQANNSVFALLGGPEDLMLIDRAAHASLIAGVRFTGAKLWPFAHNSLEHLETLLKRAKGYRKIFIVTESVFSTEGSLAPLPDILALARQFNALPVIDDSHGLGVLGATGCGVLAHFGVTDFPGIYTASLGKALAGMGGMVAGSAAAMEELEYLCPGLIYSTALTPPMLGAINGALDVIARDFPERSARLWRYKAIIAAALAGRQSGGEAPINAVACGDAERAIRLCATLYQHGILSTPFIEPSVPQNACVVRLIAGAGLEEDAVHKAAACLRSVLTTP